MKKLLTTIFLLSVVFSLSFAASNKGKSNNIKLDPKKKFVIEGAELGSLEWAQSESSVSNKGEIIWNHESGNSWLHCGWELRGTDMSQYGGLKIELASGQKQDVRVEVANPSVNGLATTTIPNDGLVYVFFSGQGKSYGEYKNPDPKEGYEIRFIVEEKNKYAKTVIKNIELIKKEDVPDASNLDLLGVPFGTSGWHTRILGNEITWPKGSSDGNAGWNLEGIDLSEYDRVRIELESNDATGLHISFNQKDGKNYYTFSNPVEKNVYEADLSGEGYSYKNEDSVTPDKSEGFSIDVRTWNEKPRTKDQKTVVKSIQLLKGKKMMNENLILLGTDFGSSGWNGYVHEGGIIEWIPSKDKNAGMGWNVKDIDFSEWDKILVELESTNVPVWLEMVQNNNRMGGNEIRPNIYEIKLDGSEGSVWPPDAKWDPSKKIDEIQIRCNKVSKANLKTKVKSVTLVKEENEVPQPERLILNGSKLGSKKSRAYVDENFAINWEHIKNGYAQCGWKLEKLEGEILEVKVSSTDVQLRLRIRDIANNNETDWLDDGSHIFRINLKNKLMQSGKNWKSAEWTKITKAFNFSQGCEIVLEPYNGVYKEGMNTVVEYIKVE